MIPEVQSLSSPLLAGSTGPLLASPLIISTVYPEPGGSAWYVLRTKPRQEVRAQENLKAWELETFLPRWPERRKNPRGCDGVRAVFPSYIFCRFSANMFAKVRFTYGVAHILSFGGKPAVVDQEIIDEIRMRMDHHGIVQPPPELGMHRGDRVLIEAGPFRSLVGVFEKEMPGSERVKILLENMSFRASVECMRSEVKKVG